MRAALLVIVWVVLLLGGRPTYSQTLGSNAFQSWATLTGTTGINGGLSDPSVNEVSMVGATGSPSGSATSTTISMDLVKGAALTLELGTFAGQNNASALRASYQIDKPSGSSTVNGSFVLLFDTITTGAGVVANTFDAGIGFNISYNGTTFSNTSSAFRLTVGTPFTGSSVTAINYTANTISNTYTETATVSGNAITISTAFLISDVSSTWKPYIGTPTLVTAFTATTLVAGTTYSSVYNVPNTATFAGSSAGAYDWFGTSASGLGTASFAIPEPSTYAWGGAFVGMGALAAWRRRRRA